jgi:hypothetical protein
MNNDFEISDEALQTAIDVIVHAMLNEKFAKNFEPAKGDFEYGLEERGGPNQDESVVDIGAWIPIGSVPDKFDADEFEDYLDEFDAERLKAIESGVSPTHEEFVAVLRSWLVQNSENQDGHCIASYGVYPLIHSNGSRCYFLSTLSGYSMSYSEHIEGFFFFGHRVGFRISPKKRICLC